MITLYDLGPSKFPEALGGSPNVRKIIFALNYKRLPFQISIIESSVESAAKSIGAPPTGARPDSSPRYTVPFIHDSTTGKSVSDSFLIGEYLDRTYPDTPKLIPEGTLVLQSVFIKAFETKVSQTLAPIFFPNFLKYLSPQLQARLERSRGPFPELPLFQDQKTIWENARKGFEELVPQAVYEHSDSIFVGGEKPAFVDMVLTAYLLTFKLMFGEESEEWSNLSGWGKGRLGRMVEEVLGYERV
ncbi:hypothetical protein L218DRAFT_943892 [Marasmius fiardii PR-910]|nr:hypothetical protein L218DRAFT_943892 [Marasmius fiardii PR-910]